MQILINVVLLLMVLGFPLAMLFLLIRFLHRRNLPDRIEPPDTIDYDKW
jgi:multisubunit Na+/H+ antiporter MnhF subunit